MKATRHLLTLLFFILVAGCTRAVAPPPTSEVVSGVISGAYAPANPPAAPALPRGMYEGELIHGFEISAFIVCGSHDRWWTEGNLDPVWAHENQVPGESTSFFTAHLYLRLIGTPSASGNYGHLGSYPRRLDVDEVLEVHEWQHTDCKPRDGA